jgi:hypothetical protein
MSIAVALANIFYQLSQKNIEFRNHHRNPWSWLFLQFRDSDAFLHNHGPVDSVDFLLVQMFRRGQVRPKMVYMVMVACHHPRGP